MARVLTIDLGVTTGFCVRDMNGDLVALGEVAYSDDVESAFLSLVHTYLPSHVVIEAPVIVNVRGELGGKLQMLISAAKHVFRTNTEYITPAQWKPRYGQTKLPPLDTTPSAHMKDAYRICEWWLKTR